MDMGTSYAKAKGLMDAIHKMVNEIHSQLKQLLFWCLA